MNCLISFPLEATGMCTHCHYTISYSRVHIVTTKLINSLSKSFDTYSGIPSGGKTTLRILFINLYLRILSFTVVDVRDGAAFT